MVDLPSLEKEFVVETPRQITDQSLENRFGLKAIKQGISSAEEILPFLKIQNQVLPSPETPDRSHHRSSWFLSYARYGENKPQHFSLKDSFSLPVTNEQEKRINNELMDELRLIPDGINKNDQTPPRLKNLSERIKDLDGWNLDTLYSLDTMDGWNTFWISLEKNVGDLKMSVTLDITYGCSLDVKIPMESFDESVREVRAAAKIMSNWLELKYPPNLGYEFSMNQGQAEDDPSRTSSSFPEYFFKTLDYWKSFSGSKQLRALIGQSNDDTKPILLLENPSLSIDSNRMGLDLISLGGTVSSSGLIVNTHPDVYEAFERAIRDRRANQNLAEIFPSENFDDRKWLHMFVNVDPENGAILVEDIASNSGKEELKNLFDLVEKQYGISYGGTIDKSQAEREARRPMFMPKINEEAAIIKEKYGSSSARIFRGYAISALVDGSKHALEKYESYLKLI